MSAEISSMYIRGKAGLAVNKPVEPVPPGWAWVLLSDVARQETGHTPSRSHPEWWGGDVPWIGIRDAGLHHGGVIHETFQTTNHLGLANSSARLLPKGTVCLSRTASVGYVTIMGRDMATSQDFATWTCSDALLPEFLLKALIAEGENLRKFGKGTTHTTIYFPEIRALHVCLPPLAEQKRIVAKLNALNAKSARARTELVRIETLVSRYKQAVLSKAFSGELTADWRQSNSATWPWRSALWKDCGETLNGRAFPSGDYCSAGVKLLRPGNLGPEGDVFWNEKNTRYLPQKYADEFPKHFIRGEAVLINLTAQSLEDQFLGRACLSLPSDEFMLNQRIGLFRPINMTNKFCLFALKSAGFRSFVDNGMNSGSLIQHVHTKQLEQYRFVVPDIEEQHEIVRRIESAFSKMDRLATQAKRALELVGKLDEAILAKAFRGELVPQDDSDEPAEKLLERIRAERAAAPKAKRGRGKR